MPYDLYGVSDSVAHDGYDAITAEFVRKVKCMPRNIASRPKMGMREWYVLLNVYMNQVDMHG